MDNAVLHIQRWAERCPRVPEDSAERLRIALDARGVVMPQSPATGQALVSNGALGVDIIRLAAGTSFAPHTHPGDHLLIVVGGDGTVTLGGLIYPTEAGEVYLVPGAVPHAVGARTDHVILAVGAPHKPVDALDRMVPVAYQAVLATTERLHCLLCQQTAVYPVFLHQLRCPHCPCAACATVAAHSDT